MTIFSQANALICSVTLGVYAMAWDAKRELF